MSVVFTELSTAKFSVCDKHRTCLAKVLSIALTMLLPMSVVLRTIFSCEKPQYSLLLYGYHEVVHMRCI